MSGDWIKIEHVTPGKPEIDHMAESLNLQADHVLGALIRLWIWADQQTLDGNANTVTVKSINRQVGIKNFAETLEKVGWLRIHKRGVTFTNFDRHNGNTSKRRALTARRGATHKQRKGNAANVKRALAREEKRRSNPLTPEGGEKTLNERATKHLAHWMRISQYGHRIQSNKALKEVRLACEQEPDDEIIGRAIEAVGGGVYTWSLVVAELGKRQMERQRAADDEAVYEKQRRERAALKAEWKRKAEAATQ